MSEHISTTKLKLLLSLQLFLNSSFSQYLMPITATNSPLDCFFKVSLLQKFRYHHRLIPLHLYLNLLELKPDFTSQSKEK